MTDIYLHCRCAHITDYMETHSYAECDGDVHVRSDVCSRCWACVTTPSVPATSRYSCLYPCHLPFFSKLFATAEHVLVLGLGCRRGGWGQFVPPTMHDCNFTYNSCIICARHGLSCTVHEGDLLLCARRLRTVYATIFGAWTWQLTTWAAAGKSRYGLFP